MSSRPALAIVVRDLEKHLEQKTPVELARELKRFQEGKQLVLSKLVLTIAGTRSKQHRLAALRKEEN